MSRPRIHEVLALRDYVAHAPDAAEDPEAAYAVLDDIWQRLSASIDADAGRSESAPDSDPGASEAGDPAGDWTSHQTPPRPASGRGGFLGGASCRACRGPVGEPGTVVVVPAADESPLAFCSPRCAAASGIPPWTDVCPDPVSALGWLLDLLGSRIDLRATVVEVDGKKRFALQGWRYIPDHLKIPGLDDGP